MAIVSSRIIHVRHQSHCPSILSFRCWSSAAYIRSTATRHPPPSTSSSSPNANAVKQTSLPDLCLGAGGKAPGFVQQMLFSTPVQSKPAKGIYAEINCTLMFQNKWIIIFEHFWGMWAIIMAMLPPSKLPGRLLISSFRIKSRTIHVQSIFFLSDDSPPWPWRR